VSDVPWLHDEGEARQVRDVLAAVGYDDDGVAEVLGGPPSEVGAMHRPLLLHRTRGGTPRETVIRLFIGGVAVEESAARAALHPVPPAWWAERGLVTVSGGQVTATVALWCYRGLHVAFDFQRRPGEAVSPEFVMSISPSSLTLAGLTVRRPNRAALDVGTGNGIQAFLSAAHSERVVATDKNPRAVAITRFNAVLNGLSHVESREGDLFEPVEGESFDLITSNPPFVISPDNVYYFLHSGMAGDEMCRTIAREAPRLLAGGGFCQFLANWTVGEGEDWKERLAGWFEGTGCNAWVLRRGSQSPDEYATTWIESEQGEAGLARSLPTWMDYYRGLGVDAIDSGLVTMQRTTAAPPWFRADDSPETMVYPAGDEIVRTFEAEDYLAARPDDAALLAGRYRVSPDTRLAQEFDPGHDSWNLVATWLRRTMGLNWSGSIDIAGANVLVRCDGTRSMRDLLVELAVDLGEEAAEVSPRWPEVVRELVRSGFLLPVG
jgi:hypothetical protein